MRHGKRVAKLERKCAHRKAMMANLVTSFFAKEIINTTEARAKELRRVAEQMITLAKRNDLHARRQVLRVIADKQIVAKLFSELGPRYKGRNGGYTRIVKVGPRRGDGALMSLIELVDRPGIRAAVKEAASSKAPEEKEVEKKEVEGSGEKDKRASG